MTLTDFNQKIVIPLKALNPSAKSPRIDVPYEDALYVYSIVNLIESLYPKDPAEKTVLAFSLGQRLMTMLKALYMFADIYLQVLASEVANKERLSFNDFLKKAVLPLAPESILPAHCLSVYRNKIIVHQDVVRGYGWTTDAEGRHRLSPHPTDFKISNKDAVVLSKLRDDYKATMPELMTENNQFMQMRLLFNKVAPTNSDGSLNQSRRKIDKIAESGGVESMTPHEIIEAIDTFSIAVIEALKRKTGLKN